MGDVTRLKNRARREEQRENWSGAIELYTRALSESQEQGDSVADLSLYNRIGDIYLRIGQKNTAIRYYEEAIERYGEQELHASAIALCNKVLRIHPGRSSVYLQLGRLHLATNLIADSGAHYHRYAEAMWELGNEQAAFEGLEELIEQTGDARSVDVWVRWLSAAGDRKAAEGRIEGLREALARHGFHPDDLLAQVGWAEASAADANQVASLDESHARDAAPIVLESEYETEEDAPPLPLLDELPAEAAPPSVELPAEPEPAPPSQDEEDWAVPWELEEDEEGLPGWGSDLPEVAATEDWGPALELGEPSDPFLGREVPPRSLDTIEPGTRDPLVFVHGPGPYPHVGCESSVLHPHLGAERPHVASYEGSEAGVELDPPPPSHGGYASESSELVARAPHAGADARPRPIDASEALVSTGQPSVSETPHSEQAEPLATRTLLTFPDEPGLDVDPAEPHDAAVTGPRPTPFRVEAVEQPADDDFPLQELVDRAESLVTDEASESTRPMGPQGGVLQRDDSIESTGLDGRGSEDSTQWAPPSIEAEPAESDPGEPLQLGESMGDGGERFDGSGSWSDANEEPERTGMATDALEGEIEAAKPTGFGDGAEPPERAGESPAKFLESLEAVRDALAEVDQASDGGEPDRGGQIEPAASETDPLDSIDESLHAPETSGPDADAPTVREDPIVEDLVAADETEMAQRLPADGGEIQSQARAEEPEIELEPWEDPGTVDSLELDQPLDPEPGSDDVAVGSAGEPIDVEEVAWPEEFSPDEPSPAVEKATRPASVGEASGGIAATSGPLGDAGEVSEGRGAMEAAPRLEGEREHAFREWVKSASPPVLRRALTELEMRAELDKGLLVVARLVDLDPDDPDLLRKRLEYAAALGDDALVVETHVNLGQGLERAGRTLEAREVYESLLALDPDHVVATEAVRRLQDVADEQVEQEEGAEFTHPIEAMHARAAIGGASRASGYGDLSTGGVLDPPGDKPQPYSGVAGGREAAADFEQLLSEFRAELHEHPRESDSTTRTELGANLKEMGRLDDAIRELQAAVREPEAPAMAYELLGEAFLDKGQARVAMRLLQQALQGSSWDEREVLGVLYQLGVAFQELGESTNALGCYERIFSVDIDYKDVQERILSCS